MKGIYYINERCCLNGLSIEESMNLQKESIKQYLSNHNIETVKLNPFQLYDHYTILHALLYDLKKDPIRLDCFIYYSPDVIEDFIYSYPAKWLILKSYFKEFISIEAKSDFHIPKAL
ncbi:hypothetical protein [Neobacillus dielmonensis]|uniref:hypothetical protein n=1 Tax=Neobacillus dielmonensis TaxID=1347369 RepID=UPI0005A94483|nr:hypothetical protein [Neobacillus dielmonensis]